MVIDLIKEIIANIDKGALYILSLITSAMIIDFISGVLAAKINKKIIFTSRIGINGIIKKIATLVLLVFFIPVAKLIPGGTGLGLLYTLYIGYLIMELQSILENYKKMGINTAIFSNFIEKFKNNGKEE
ncbi:phage holin family protein [Vagococcus fluvialis]|uniref:phage holin family protein n=1 Tax=Vagococcus fluvialis TaxID=2738 RepID=UPI00288D5410|nr:phage holin family protein [Vagococcus fluvialis]MDT2782652.1 phage holin family protein [Vagococcus fluvialis]